MWNQNNFYFWYADGSDFKVSYPYKMVVNSSGSGPCINPGSGFDNDSTSGSGNDSAGNDSTSGSGTDSGSGSGNDSGSGSGDLPINADDNRGCCFTVTIFGDSIVEDLLEFVDLQVDFGDIFVDNITITIQDDDSKF